MAYELKHIPIASIRENEVALRSVNRDEEGFLGLVDSIKDRGILNPINVRQKTDVQTGEVYFEIIDGLHRYSAGKLAGLAEIPAQIIPLADAEVLVAQIIANVHKVETKPVEYTKQMQRILAVNTTMTMTELAAKLHQTPGWISQRFSLLKLDPKIAELVDQDKINLSNAYALAKLDTAEQANYVDRAITEAADVFCGAINQRVKEIRDARRQGRETGPTEFAPTPHFRKLSIAKDEMIQPTALETLIRKAGITSPLAAAQLAIRWVLNMDDDSVADAKAKDDARKAAVKAEADRKKAEKQAAKDAAAAKEAVAVVTA